MGASVLDDDASKNSATFHDQTLGARARRLRVNSSVGILSEDGRAATGNDPGVRDADFHGTEDGIEMDDSLVTLNLSFGKINLEFAEDRRDLSAPEILGVNPALGSAENDVGLHIRRVRRKSPIEINVQGPDPL
jgi:hypothetical protein